MKKQPKILIVDDEADLRETISYDFKMKNYEVLTASGGHEALEIIKNNQIDVVISDIRMPRGDGMELLEQIKNKYPIKPVVILVTGSTDVTLEEAYDKGADAMFSKPFDRKALVYAVERAILPVEVKLSRKTTRIDYTFPVETKSKRIFNKSGEVIQNIGRGGIFIAYQKEMPVVGDTVCFSFETNVEPRAKIEGEGVVRWARNKDTDTGPKGCGVEFTNLTDSSARTIIKLVNHLKTKAFIPGK